MLAVEPAKSFNAALQRVSPSVACSLHRIRLSSNILNYTLESYFERTLIELILSLILAILPFHCPAVYVHAATSPHTRLALIQKPSQPCWQQSFGGLERQSLQRTVPYPCLHEESFGHHVIPQRNANLRRYGMLRRLPSSRPRSYFRTSQRYSSVE